MRALLYLLVFVAIMGGFTFAFFTMSTPDIPQQVVTRVLDPKEAFAPTPLESNPIMAPASP